MKNAGFEEGENIIMLALAFVTRIYIYIHLKA
jgi:hypothetical protein